jgi:hypothetical protein
MAKYTDVMNQVFESKYFVALITLITMLVVFVPLAVAPPDDNPDNANTLDVGKSMLKSSRGIRITVATLSCVFVIIPLAIKAYMDTKK